MNTRNVNSLAALGKPRRITSKGRKRAAMVAALCTAFSIAPILVGAGATGAANASNLVPCTYGPVESRLEVDCDNRDFTPATVEISAWCTNFAYIGGNQRMEPQGHTHITRDCGPGAHPVVWFVQSESDWEALDDRLDEMEREHDDEND